MGISLNSIRQFSGSGSLVLDAQGTGLQSSKIAQHLRSFFDMGDARQKNAETLMAIHHAFLNDPRFATKDLQQQAAKLLADVRVDRAIDASQIKAIVKEMDRLANVTPQTLDERVKLQLAFTVRRFPILQFYTGEVANIATQQVRRAVAAGQNPVDVAGIVEEVSELAMTARSNTTDESKPSKHKLMDFAVAHLHQFVERSDGTLRSKEEVVDAVRHTCDFYTDAKDAKANSADAFEFIDTVGRKLPKGLFAKIGAHVLSMQAFLTRRLPPGSSPSEDIVKSIIGEFAANEVRFRPIYKDDSPYSTTPLFKNDDHTACKAVARYEAKQLALVLPGPVSDTICRGMHVQSVQEALEKAIYDAMVM